MGQKKIAIITYHRSYNYGAALQAYATVRFFESMGYYPQIIDYYPANLRGYGTYKNSFFDVSNATRSFPIRCLLTLLKTPGYKRLKKAFDPFIDRELPLTKAYYSKEELKRDLPDADIFCTGSDQVWNNYYTHEFDDAFFLSFVPGNKTKISFSSSFGKSEFTEDENKYIKEQLGKYDYISVRENTGIGILEDLGYTDCDLMLDPTLMVQPSVWAEFASSAMFDFEYVLVYQLHGDSDTYDRALQIARIHKLKIVRIITMPHQRTKDCINVVTPDIRQYVSLFMNARIVVTDSFHGTVFSILNNKKLAVTMPKRFGDRITTLANAIGAEDMILDDIDKWDRLDYNALYVGINDKLQKLRQEKNALFVKRMKELL